MKDQNREPEEGDRDTIDTGVAGAALAAIAIELEMEFPGIIGRAGDRLEATHLRAAAISLRGPRMEPKIREDIANAVGWLRVASLFAEAELGPVAKRRRRQRRRA